MENAPDYLKSKAIDMRDPETGEVVLDDITGLPIKVYGIKVCGAPIGDDAFERSWLAAKADEICSSINKTTKVLSSRSAQAAHSVTYYSSLSLADYVCATNRPSQTKLFRAKIDVALRTAYADVVGVDILNPRGHDDNLHEDREFTRDLFMLKINQGGGGFRPYSERINFLNCLNNILPQMLDAVPKEGATRKGLWTSHTDWIGPNSFDEVNELTRWSQFFSNTGSVIAQELQSEIGRVTRLYLDAIEPLGIDPDTETDSPFYERTGDGKLAFGLGIQKLQKACFDDIKRHRFANITLRAQALPLDDPRRMAFFGRYGDKCVRQLFLGFAHNLVPLQSDEFRVAVQRSFGLPLSVLAAHVGATIRNHANCKQLTVDAYGHSLQSVTGAKGDDTRTLHDAFLAALAHSLREVGIKFRGGLRANHTCKHIFSHLMHAYEGADEATQKKLNGIIADLLVDFTSVAVSAPGGEDSVDAPFALVQTLCDTKTLACGDAYKRFGAEQPGKRETFPVERRAERVSREYLLTARSLDRDIHKTVLGEVGPIEAKLLEYGAREGPKAHAVVGLVLGAFGELSNSCYSLCTAIARVSAAKLLSFWQMSAEQALALSKQKILRFWGLTAQRGWARLILDRLNDLVVSPDAPMDGTRDPDADAHEQHTFFFPDNGHGAAAAAGFGWRGGGGGV
jgi:hypothetical protein